MKISNKLLKYLFYLTLLLNAIFVLQVFGSAGEVELDVFFNSDGLYLPSIYKDLFIDHSGFEGWHLNAAPNFFPEWPLYFLIRYISGNFKIAGAIYSLVYVLAVNLLTVTVVKRGFSKIEYTYLIFINIGFALFLHQYLLMGYFYETAFLFFVGFHGGAYFMALLSLLFFILYLKHGKVLHLVFLALSVGLGALSDRLLIMYFVFPSLLVLALAGNREYRRKIFISSLASVIATGAGMLAYSKIKHSGFIYFIGLGEKKFNISQIGSSFSNYMDSLERMIKAGSVEFVIVVLFFVALLAGIVLSVYIVLGKGRKSYPFLEKTLIIFLSAYIPVVVLTPILNGTFWGLGHLRYNYSAFYVAVSFFVVLLYVVGRRTPVFSQVVKVLAVMLVVASTFSVIRNEQSNPTLSGLKKLSDYYPEEARLMDELAKEYQLQYGIAEYWFAKKITMFSKEDLRIYHVVHNLHPWVHVTNENWYKKTGKGKYGYPNFNFVILNNLKPNGEFYDELKEKSDTVMNGRIEVLLTPEFEFKDRRRPNLVVSE